MSKLDKIIVIGDLKIPTVELSKKLTENFSQNGLKREISLISKLGNGSFGYVYEIIYNRIPNRYAIKIMAIIKNKDDRENCLEINIKQEINLSRNLFNANIIKSVVATNFIYETKDKKYSIFAVIMEKAKYRDLNLFISHFQKHNILKLTMNTIKFNYIHLMCEYTMKFFLKQIIKGLFFLNTNNLIHGDIKPGNILIGENYVLKLCDFSITKSIPKEKTIHISSGTDEFSPPESFKRSKISRINAGKNDIHATGCILFTMQNQKNLVSKNNGKLSEKDCKKQIIKGIKEENDLNFYSKGCKEFTNNLIAVDPDKRFNHIQALEDQWLNDDEKVIKKICQLNECEKGIKMFIEFQKENAIVNCGYKNKIKRNKFKIAT